MKPLSSENGVLVLVDYQARLMPMIHGGAAAVAEAMFLATVARQLGLRVVGTEQNPARLGENVAALRALCEPTLAKMHFDACRDGLVEVLRGDGSPVGPVVIAGCEAHVCLLQTTLGLIDAGLEVAVVASACGSMSALDHAAAMRRLERAGAVIATPEMVAFEWLATCENPGFKPVLDGIKQRAAALRRMN